MIWLGPSDPSSEAAFSLLHSLEKTFGQGQSIPIDEREMTDLSHAQIRAILATKLGMDHLLADLIRQQQHLMQQYLEAETAFLTHLEEIAGIHEKTQAINDKAKAVLPPHRKCPSLASFCQSIS